MDKYAQFRAHSAYAVLGVDSTATAAEIDAAYKRIIKSVHTDRGGASTAIFQIVNDAKRILTEERAAYDEWSQAPKADFDQPTADPWDAAFAAEKERERAAQSDAESVARLQAQLREQRLEFERQREADFAGHREEIECQRRAEADRQDAAFERQRQVDLAQKNPNWSGPARQTAASSPLETAANRCSGRSRRRRDGWRALFGDGMGPLGQRGRPVCINGRNVVLAASDSTLVIRCDLFLVGYIEIRTRHDNFPADIENL